MIKLWYILYRLFSMDYLVNRGHILITVDYWIVYPLKIEKYKCNTNNILQMICNDKDWVHWLGSLCAYWLGTYWMVPIALDHGVQCIYFMLKTLGLLLVGPYSKPIIWTEHEQYMWYAPTFVRQRRLK
jgi:hypothetical protein